MTDCWQIIEIMFCAIGFSIALAPKLEISPIETGLLCAAIDILLTLCFGK